MWHTIWSWSMRSINIWHGSGLYCRRYRTAQFCSQMDERPQRICSLLWSVKQAAPHNFLSSVVFILGKFMSVNKSSYLHLHSICDFFATSSCNDSIWYFSNNADGQTDRQKDKVKPVFPPFNFVVDGGIKIPLNIWDHIEYRFICEKNIIASADDMVLMGIRVSAYAL